MRESSYNQFILSLIDNVRQEWRLNPINIGGTSGSGGGSGGPPGGFNGLLPQKQVAGDTTESFLFTSGSNNSLLPNLNNIRAWEVASAQFYATHTDPISAHLNISSGSWHYTSGSFPMMYEFGTTPDISPPTSGMDRYDLLTINTAGVLSWTHGVESATPTEPNLPTATSGSMPLWMIYARSSGSCIQQHDDGVSHYIFRDYRPLFTWGVGGSGGGGTHNLLSATHPDTVPEAVLRGDLIVGKGASPKWDSLHLGASGEFLGSNGTDIAWSTPAGGGGGIHEVVMASGVIPPDPILTSDGTDWVYSS